MENKKEEKRSMANLREGNISLILDSYDDLFSDFDPRPYGEKSLSNDFLNECKKAASDKENRLELRFLIPKQKRNYQDEIRIKRRLREHFQRHHRGLDKEIKTIRWKGIAWFFIGVILMLAATFLINLEERSFFYNLLIIIVEPAGWFTFWEGLNMVFFATKEKMPDYIFYRKMADAEISFLDY